MSKSSTASLPKIPLPTKSAWAKGPPQNSAPSAPSPRSQSPAPASNAPQPTHSRRPSALGQGVPIKDGVSVPRNNVGAVKQGSAVTFGSIDDASAPISSSPAATPAAAITSEAVRSFGSVPATNMGHVNGKMSISKSIGTSSTPSTSTSATSTSASALASTSAPISSSPAPSISPTPTKPKMDVRMFFQNPSTPAPPSQPETSSPSLRQSSSLPPQAQQNPSQPSSQPSQLGAHPYTSFVPRQPSQQNAGAPRSPVYPRQPMPNGNGPRPPNGPAGPGGPSQMSTGLGSPRMSQHQHPQQGMAPPSMQPQMQQQMQPQMAWNGQFYYPAMPTEQPQYMYAGWYQPQMPQPQQMPHHPAPPMPQQQGMPMSPRNHPLPIHSGPGTPTPAHAVPATHHVPPPLVQHSSSSSASSLLSTPPPTPSSARLNTNATTFIPGGAPRPKSKIVLKNADGQEVNLENLKQQTQTPSQSPAPSVSTSTSTATTPVTSPPPSAPSATGSPGHHSRRSVQIRMESPEARTKRIAEEEAKEKEKEEKEKARAKAEAEEKERREEARKESLRKELEEKERIRLDKERKRKEEEEEEKERRRLEEQRRKEEEAAKVEKARKEKEEKEREEKEKEREEKEEKERLQREEEERQTLKKEEEARLKKEQEEATAASAAVTEEPESISEAEEGEVQEVMGKSAADKEDDKEEADATSVKEKSKDLLRIDTNGTSGTVDFPRRRPGPLDLSSTYKPGIPAALPSALATARIIDDLSRVPYPENIQSPKVELNINAKDGKFRYDRDFLLQFMSICKEKPDNLPPLDAIGIGPVDQNSMTRTTSRGGTHRPGRTPSISSTSGAHNAPGFPGLGTKVPPGYGSMGNFGSGATKLSSQERFELANGTRTSSGSAVGSPFSRPVPMTRTASQPGVGSALGSKRTRSKRGETRDKNNSQLDRGSTFNSFAASGFEMPPPLQVTANRWDRRVLSQIDPDAPEIVDRKVKSLLNKLSMEKFDSISDQIIEWANKSEKEKDGRTLIQVIRLVFEKATDEATWSEMYARLCRKMMEQISPKVQDDGIKNAEGKPITGGQLFRKYLLNRCQEDFERGWVAKEATAAAAATKAMEDKAAKAANDLEQGTAGATNEDPVLYSDEYYAAQKAKRQGLGLIKFIGELFKLQMLTERIMHECVKKLLGNVENPEEEEIESLCKLLTTVGGLLDTPKARAHLDVYFSRMNELCKSNSVGSRMQFMLQDVIELRERKWAVRSNQMAAPTTIAAVHEAAAKEQAKAEKDTAYQRTVSMSRGGSRRGGDRGDFQGPDGWTNVASSNAPRPPPKAGDLSNFGKIGGKGLPMTFGPSSVFAGKKESKRESLSRTNSSSNMFSMLRDAEASTDSKAAAPEPQRRRLVLAPRTKPTADEQESATAEGTPAGSDNSSDEEDATPDMTVEAAGKKIDEDLKEFFAIRNIDEAEAYFTALPAVHHHRLVEKLVERAVETKEVDAQLVAALFDRAVSKELCSVDAFEEGFNPLVEILDDIAIDAPKAPHNMALMMKSVSFDSERTARITAKAGDGVTLLELLS